MKKYFIPFVFFFLIICAAQGQEWKWILPMPQSNTLRSVKFADQNTVFAAGDYCTIVKSIDQGKTWVAIRSGGNIIFTDIYFSSPEIGFVAGLPATIMKTTDGGANWNTVYQKNDGKLSQVIMAGPYTGFAVGDSLILKSNDGGETWNEIFNGLTNWNSVYFIDENRGFVAGNSGKMMRTTDGGVHWFELNTGTSSNINSVVFVNDSTGYAVGDSSLLLRTNNDGDSWNLLFIDAYTDFLSLSFADETTGYGIGEDGLVIMTDDGYNWRAVPLYTYSPTYSIDCAPGSKYVSVVVGKGGKILRTIYQWTVIERITDPLGTHTSCAFRDENTGFVIGNEFLKTEDGGRSWEEIPENNYSLENDIIFIDSLTGIIGTSQGKYSKTTNGGDTWHEFQIPWCSSDITGIEHSGPSAVYMSAFDLYKTTDLGLTWMMVIEGYHSNFPRYVTNTSFPDAKTGYAIGSQIWKTTDYGITWTGISPVNYGYYTDVFFIDSIHGVVCGDGGNLMYTADGGITFTECDSHVSNGLNSISFDNNTWYIVGDYGVILESVNGIDWILNPPMTTKNLLKVYFTKGHTGIITGNGQTLLRKGTESAGIEQPTVAGKLKVYPNPARDYFIIDLNNISDALIEIIDSRGVIVQSYSVHQGGNLLRQSVAGLPAGLYVVKLSGEGKLYTQKVLKY